MSVMHLPFCPAFISCCYQHVFYFVQINMDGWMDTIISLKRSYKLNIRVNMCYKNRTSLLYVKNVKRALNCEKNGLSRKNACNVVYSLSDGSDKKYTIRQVVFL